MGHPDLGQLMIVLGLIIFTWLLVAIIALTTAEWIGLL